MRYVLLFLFSTVAFADAYIEPDGFGGYRVIERDRGANPALMQGIMSGTGNPMQMLRESRQQDAETRNIELENELLLREIERLKAIERWKRSQR